MNRRGREEFGDIPPMRRPQHYEVDLTTAANMLERGDYGAYNQFTDELASKPAPSRIKRIGVNIVTSAMPSLRKPPINEVFYPEIPPVDVYPDRVPSSDAENPEDYLDGAQDSEDFAKRQRDLIAVEEWRLLDERFSDKRRLELELRKKTLAELKRAAGMFTASLAASGTLFLGVGGTVGDIGKAVDKVAKVIKTINEKDSVSSEDDSPSWIKHGDHVSTE